MMCRVSVRGSRSSVDAPHFERHLRNPRPSRWPSWPIGGAASQLLPRSMSKNSGCGGGLIDGQVVDHSCSRCRGHLLLNRCDHGGTQVVVERRTSGFAPMDSHRHIKGAWRRERPSEQTGLRVMPTVARGRRWHFFLDYPFDQQETRRCLLQPGLSIPEVLLAKRWRPGPLKWNSVFLSSGYVRRGLVGLPRVHKALRDKPKKDAK